MSQPERRTIIGFVLSLTILVPLTAYGQGTLFVEGNNVGIGIETPTAPLHVEKGDGTAKVIVRETNATTTVRNLFELHNNGGPFFIFADTSRGESYSFAMSGSGDFIISHQQTPGVEFRMTPSGNVTITGALVQGSSRDTKSGIAPVDPGQILRQVVDLPLASWSYTADATGARHLGPMAEDFRERFGLGSTPHGISTIDTSGVALAAIQGLHEIVERQAAIIEELQERIERLETEGMAAPVQPPG